MKRLLAALAVASLIATGCSGQEGVDGQASDAGSFTGEETTRPTIVAEFAQEETTQVERTLPNTGGPGQ